jgi:hypothetical protein
VIAQGNGVVTPGNERCDAFGDRIKNAFNKERARHRRFLNVPGTRISNTALCRLASDSGEHRLPPRYAAILVAAI